MKNHTNKNRSGCRWLLWVIAILVIWAIYSSNHKENTAVQKSSTSNNNIRNSAISATSKPLSPTSTKNTAANVIVIPTSTPVPTPIYIIYNSKDVNGAPFYSKPNNVQDFLIRSLGNETQIELIGEMESHNNYDWFPIRDDRGREGWIQAIYVSDTRHVNLKPSDINKSVPTKTMVPTRKPAATNTPVPARKPTSAPFIKSWTCYDVTSIDYNWDNDNKCVSNTNEVRYVGDSEAMRLDPSYHPR